MSHLALIIIISLSVLSGCAAVQHREEIGVLIDLGNEQKEQEKHLKKEAVVFEQAKEAILAGELNVGMSAKAVRSKLGEPVLQLEDGSEATQKWVYKTGDAGWLKSEIIRVYFDEEDTVKRWACVNLECPKS